MSTRSKTAPPTDLCAYCEEAPGKPCPSCLVRSQRIATIVDDGAELEQAARHLNLTEQFAAELLAEHRQRRELKTFAQSHVPNAPVRELFEYRQARDPEVTLSSISKAAGFRCPNYLSRLLGYKMTTGSTTKEVHYPGKLLTSISVENAGRIVRALGFCPAEVAHSGVLLLDGRLIQIKGL